MNFMDKARDLNECFIDEVSYIGIDVSDSTIVADFIIAEAFEGAIQRTYDRLIESLGDSIEYLTIMALSVEWLSCYYQTWGGDLTKCNVYVGLRNQLLEYIQANFSENDVCRIKALLNL